MQNSLQTLNPFLSLFLQLASEMSTSFFAPGSPAASTGAARSMTESHAEYSVFVPASAAPRRAPLLVMLHGAGQDPEDFAAGTAMNDAAERHGVVVLYPAQLVRHNAQRCWNWFDADHQTRSRGDAARVASLTQEVVRDLEIDPDRIYVAGLSAGGALAALLGEIFPEIYAAVGVHSGLAPRAGTDLSSALAAMRGVARMPTAPSGVPTIVFHGDKDMVVSPLNATQVIEASVGPTCPWEDAEHIGSDGRRSTRRTYWRHGVGCGEHWTLHEGGHAWSGGRTAGSYADPLGPDASEEMLRFFEAHRRGPVAVATKASCGTRRHPTTG
ncbi:extracellular catalytic domain type 1 short-chain-length polyhydroxyalkanoate depolymerase [Variovorax saccharolyticus]|uniref:extracellular catalytic domain type 1 short-chain-length polyhydroxyalkanoate depolymerase n=1 Tax=Variovorax saccharolyticus TaxID=3053516 RepID=UPI002576431B|nr:MULTISPECIES: PHB depolymerase family esterase [unclassified Variovorax]MDM0022493.1 PHB depolymerase family esterase [Variovorax sp. J22R187]MDM0028257.1 PHB depolymerase family esterase [Variovorax sp. J31P216]